MIRNLFTSHPSSVGETYLAHMGQAFRFSACLLAACFACLVHAVLPFLFVNTGSSIIGGLHDRMVAGRSKTRSGAKERAVPE